MHEAVILLLSSTLELVSQKKKKCADVDTRDRGCRDGFPRDNLSKLITNNINNKYIINVHNYINTVSFRFKVMPCPLYVVMPSL